MGTAVIGFLAFSAITLIFEWILLTAMDAVGSPASGKVKRIASRIIIFTFIAMSIILIILCCAAALEYFQSEQIGTGVKLIITIFLMLISLYILFVRKQIRKPK